MKHSIKVTVILLSMFLIAQLIGLLIVHQYKPVTSEVSINGTIVNETTHNLPFALEPPKGISPVYFLINIIISIIIAVSIMFILMRFGAATFLRFWFFFVVALALGITFFAFIKLILPQEIGLFGSIIDGRQIIALILSLPLSYIKVFKRNIVVHNATELLIYPGIASIFVPLFNIFTICLLLVFISLYDIYAVWHAGFMQKMAKFQIKTLKVFSGFFVPYLGKKEKTLIQNAKRSKSKKGLEKIKVNIAILGGGDIVFPIIMAGVVLLTMGLIEALLISIGATIALALLFYYSEKGKFYPAMPFITAGCFVALIFAYLI